MRLYNTASPSIKLQIRPPRGLARATLIPIRARRACRWPLAVRVLVDLHERLDSSFGAEDQPRCHWP